MYKDETTQVIFYRNLGDLRQAAEVSRRMVQDGINRGGLVEEVQVTIRVIGKIKLRPGQQEEE